MSDLAGLQIFRARAAQDQGLQPQDAETTLSLTRKFAALSAAPAKRGVLTFNELLLKIGFVAGMVERDIINNAHI